MTKILFLDFDGVLNTNKTQERFTFPRNGGTFTGLDKKLVARLNTIVESVPHPLKIVVSSTWRTALDLHELQDALYAAGFKYPYLVVDTTPQHKKEKLSNLGFYSYRGEEIQAWMDEQGVTADQIAILDDLEDMRHLEPRLVRTDMWDGALTENHMMAVINLLKEDR